MPNYFTLTRKGDPTGTEFVKIDEEMCKHFKVECHPEMWHFRWYDIIGHYLVSGQSFDVIRATCQECLDNAKDDREKQDTKHWLEIIDWLDTNFTVDSWSRIGKL